MSTLTNKNFENFTPTQEQLDSLTKRERKYFNIMRAKSGVLFITSRPGEAKSSIARSIAKKMGMQYFDVRLSMVDETEVGLFPFLGDVQVQGKDGEMHSIKSLDYAVPKWALLANDAPSIVHFEELNRATLAVRNAALQLLLERTIGTEFAFNGNVYMMSSGNLGEEDGTDVEEFDSALNSRLIHFKQELSAEEWIESYANENVVRPIVSYIKSNPEQIYKKGKEGDRAFANPRTWTFLSDFLKVNLGEEANTNLLKVREAAQDVAQGYVGSFALGFLRHLDESMQLSIHDVLKNYDRVKEKVEKANRDKKSELLNNLKELNVFNFKGTEVDNLVKFLHLVNEDERVAYLTYIVDGQGDEVLRKQPLKQIFANFKDLLSKISHLS